MRWLWQLCRAGVEVDSQTEEALVASKVDYLAEEYSQLLVSQLDEQRAYFGALLEKQAAEALGKAQEGAERCKGLEAALQSTAADAKAAERKCRAAENKLVSSSYLSCLNTSVFSSTEALRGCFRHLCFCSSISCTCYTGKPVCKSGRSHKGQGLYQRTQSPAGAEPDRPSEEVQDIGRYQQEHKCKEG